MPALEIILLATALLVGATGTWSPCGFSMIETIGPVGHTGGRRTTIAACATFLPGAVTGGVLTFATLGAAGALAHGQDQRLAYLIAAVIAVGVAVLEARDTPIVPQVRRQLPEHWRRLMPMPVAAALYGCLLGLGFTTFVLTFGVWAMAAIVFALGEPALGLMTGVAFGIGRALPVVALAPLAGTGAGARATELMAGRPGIYRGLRLGDALALALVAMALVGSGEALAERTEVEDGADPGAGDGLVYQLGDRSGVLLRDGVTTPLPGKDPAIGGPYIAVRSQEEIDVLDSETLAPLASLPAPGVDALGISEQWVAWRVSGGGTEEILARRIEDLQAPGEAERIDRAGDGKVLGPPSVDGAKVAYAVSSQRRNAIVRKKLESGKGGAKASSKFKGLHSPSLRGDALLYVQMSKSKERLVLKRFGGGSRTLHTQREGFLWGTALDDERAYVALIRGGDQQIISTGR